ncbi:MAG TPA: hypothetical protein VMV87_03400, partial [Burkholderiales bacterium]|nr:hypothetical protein [Burkholderiales bacterium]
RVVVEQVSPYLEKLADLAETAADFAEKHPDAVKAALAIAGSAGVLGAGLTTVGQAATGLAAIQSLVEKGGATAGALRIGGTVALYAGAVYIGAELGAELGNVLGKAIYGEQRWKQQYGEQGGGIREALATAYQIGQVPGLLINTALRDLGLMSPETAAKSAAESARMSDFIKGVTPAGTLPRTGQVPGTAGGEAALTAFIAYQEANTQAVKEHEARRNEIVKQYGEERVELEGGYEKQRNQAITDFERQQDQAGADFRRSQGRSERNYEQGRERQMRDFLREQMEAEAEYYQERSELVAEHGLEARRAEEDHQRDMSRLREDYQMSQEDAITARDATAFLRNARAYEVSRRRAEEDYSVQAGRRDEDYALQLQQMQTAFAEQRDERLAHFQLQLDDQKAQYEQQQADAKADFKIQQDRAREQQQERLDQMSADHQDEMIQLEIQKNEDLQALNEKWDAEYNLRQDKFRLQLEQLGVFIDDEGQKRQKYYEDMEAEYKALLGRLAAATPHTGRTTGHQAGGYAGSGLYRLGEAGREFVLSAGSTRAAEGLTGGWLNQDRLLATLAAGRGAIAFNQSNTFNGLESGYAGLLAAFRSQTIALIGEYAAG